MSQIFQTPARLITGIGCFDQVGAEVKRLGQRCLVVTGAHAMQEQGIFDKTLHLLRQAGVAASACTGVEHDPSVATVDRVREVLKRNGCDVVLGLGGGSAIDVAKAAAGLAPSTLPTLEHLNGVAMPASAVRIVAAPSTFGTGSEVTRVAVLSDPANRVKKSIRHACMLPQTALIDPVLGAGAPPRLTAACGLDALTQAIESYFSRHATDLTRAMSLSAMVLLVAGLPRAVRDGHDLEARENCANASTMAGIALHNARLGLAHGLAHPLGIRYAIPHGEVCGILLPHILRYNREAAGEHYTVLSGMLGTDLAEFCSTLVAGLGLPADLKGYAIPPADFPAIIAEALASGSTAANPRRPTGAELEELLTGIV